MDRWAYLTAKEKECRENAKKEKSLYISALKMDEMHEAYEKMLKDAEEWLVKIYEKAENADGGEVLPASEEVNEEVVGVLQDALGKSLGRVDLSSRLRFLLEAFGRISGFKVFNLSDNQLEVTFISLIT